jgi:polyisoprenoid-binding protein YceI
MKRIGFETSMSLNRRDFGLTYGKAATIGDVVTVEISVEATRK